jgi:hypothetical protein
LEAVETDFSLAMKDVVVMIVAAGATASRATRDAKRERTMVTSFLFSCERQYKISTHLLHFHCRSFSRLSLVRREIQKIRFNLYH